MADSQYYIPIIVKVTPASSDQEPIIANLFELYAHDMSEFVDIEPGEDGRFGYPHLSAYWKEQDRYPFLIRVRGSLAGFALIQRGLQISNDRHVMDMAEFFIIRRCRRLGVGTTAACDIWKRYPGPWEVRVRDRNHHAKAFWRQAIESLTGHPVQPLFIQKDGESWQIFSFHSP
jgi:predicted acetyltransferase